MKHDFLEKKLNVPEEPVVACLAVEKRDMFLTGQVARYRLNGDRTLINILDQDGKSFYNLEADKLDTFIRELQAIARNIENSKQKLEMW